MSKAKKQTCLLLFVVFFSIVIFFWLGNSRFNGPPGKEIDFFKGIRLSLNASENDLEEAKTMGANIVDFAINVYPKKDGSWTLGDSPVNWQKILSSQVKVAQKKGLPVSLTLFFYPELYTREPSAWLNHAKPLYREVGEFAAKNSVYLVFVPGEIEVATGATCCGDELGADLVPTAKNELSAKDVSYWSARISHELKDELRKNFSGYIGADLILGVWWYEGGRLAGVPLWKMDGFYALRSGIPRDDLDFDLKPAASSLNHLQELKEVAGKMAVEKILFFGPLANSLERIRGEKFSFAEEKRQQHYEIFFRETRQLTDGYFLEKFPPPLYDPVAIETAKEWFKKF